MLEVTVGFEGIKLCKTICNKTICCHKSNDIDYNNGYYCFNPKKALFVRHARTNKKGIVYGYGNWFCCAKIVYDGLYNMFSSSEEKLMKSKL